MRTTWTTLEDLVAGIPNGALIATGGFMLGRVPMAAVFEIARQQKRYLKIIALPNPLPAEILVAAGCVSKVEAAFIALNLDNKLRPMPTLKKAIEAGTIDWAEHDGYRVVQRLRAAGMGVPFLPAPDAELCDLCETDPPPTVVDPFTGARVAVEPAVYPDVAIVHAQAADALGNLFIDDATTDLLIAHAARKVLATAETKVDRLERVTIPGFMVHAIAHVPKGAQPTGCAGFYPHDEAALLDYLTRNE